MPIFWLDRSNAINRGVRRARLHRAVSLLKDHYRQDFTNAVYRRGVLYGERYALASIDGKAVFCWEIQ